MLTVTLRKLERDGLVSRKVYPAVPPHTQYALTPLGISFTEPVMAVANWAIAAQPQIEQNRERFKTNSADKGGRGCRVETGKLLVST